MRSGETDVGAAGFALLAWEDPNGADGALSPNLRVGASLDGMLVALLAATGVPLRGLRLGECGLALKGERGGRCR